MSLEARQVDAYAGSDVETLDCIPFRHWGRYKIIPADALVGSAASECASPTHP